MLNVLRRKEGSKMRGHFLYKCDLEEIGAERGRKIKKTALNDVNFLYNFLQGIHMDRDHRENGEWFCSFSLRRRSIALRIGSSELKYEDHSLEVKCRSPPDPVLKAIKETVGRKPQSPLSDEKEPFCPAGLELDPFSWRSTYDLEPKTDRSPELNEISEYVREFRRFC